MGNRRIGRKRLYGIEKQGQTVDLESGAGISAAIKSASQHRQGQEIITEIAIDLGADGTITTSGNGSNGLRSPIGTNGKDPAITRLTAAKYGIITEIRAVVVEVPNSVADLDIETGSTGGVTVNTGTPAIDGGTRASLITTLNAAGVDKSAAINDNSAEDDYLYLCQGANDTAEAFSQGKILIYIHGFAVPADI